MANNNYTEALEFFVEHGVILEDYQLEQLQYLYEGANIDITKIAWRIFQEYRKESKAVNECLYDYDYKGAKNHIAIMKQCIGKMNQEFDSIDTSTFGSKTFGAIAAILINIAKSLLPSYAAAYKPLKTVSNIAGSISRGTASASAKAQQGMNFVEKGAKKVSSIISNKAAKKGIEQGVKVGKGIANFSNAAGQVSKVAGKAAPWVTAIITGIDTLKSTIKDFSNMKKDADENPNANGNLYRAKVKSMLKQIDDEINILDRYCDLNANNKSYAQTKQ